jgi:phosphotransferase family enzyme
MSVSCQTHEPGKQREEHPVWAPGTDRRFPDTEVLATGLSSVFAEDGLTRPVIILDREPAANASSFEGEVVSCQIAGGGRLRLFCKYQSCVGDPDHPNHRHGIDYEAEVYRHVLRASPATVPGFYGVYKDVAAGETWLVLEYLDAAIPLNDTSPPGAAMREAARWIGRFHAMNENRVLGEGWPFLKRYDADYYLGWARRTLLFGREIAEHQAWLPGLCQRYIARIDAFLSHPATLIHGEFESNNIMCDGATVYPVDWESAAVAAGEIDLASLTWGWSAEIIQDCEQEYQRARWPDGAPTAFEQRLAMARMYLLLRWLGDRPEWTTPEGSRWFFDELRLLGEREGLI